jgi:hypothetical protein
MLKVQAYKHIIIRNVSQYFLNGVYFQQNEL